MALPQTQNSPRAQKQMRETSHTNSARTFTHMPTRCHINAHKRSFARTRKHSCGHKRNCIRAFTQLHMHTPARIHAASTCAEGYFRCGDGSGCIEPLRQCDAVNNCEDGSDEAQCDATGTQSLQKQKNIFFY